MTHGSLSPLTASTTNQPPRAVLAKTLQQPLCPEPPIWQQGKVGPLYLLIISRPTLSDSISFQASSSASIGFNCILRVCSQFRIWVCFAPQQSVNVSSVYKCQSPFYQANLLNRKPLIRVRLGGPSMVLEARRVRRRQLWVVLSALMDHTGAYRPPCQLPKIAHHPQPKIQSPLTDHQTPVQKWWCS